MRDFTDITFVLDRSGSMSSLAGDVVGGYKTFVEEQQKLGDNATLTLVQFDDRYELAIPACPIKHVNPALAFSPGGMTALLDAVGRAIVDTGVRLSRLSEDQRPDKVLFVIMTDGEENSSHEFSRERVKQLVDEQTAKYNWKFVFLGANIDAFGAAKSLGFGALNTSNYVASSVGTRAAFHTAQHYTTTLRTHGNVGQSVAAIYEQSVTKVEADDASKV